MYVNTNYNYTEQKPHKTTTSNESAVDKISFYNRRM